MDPLTPVPFDVATTPDDGVRRSARRLWDETTRPSGPSRDPERTYSAPELATGRHLVDVHDHLRAELTELDSVLDQVEAGELTIGDARSALNVMAVRQNRWTLGGFCAAYCRVVTTHHTIEDASMFPSLVRRDPRLAPVVDRLQAEHLVIHDVLEEVDRAMVAMVAAPDGLAAVRAALDLLADTLLSHLAYEERELVEPLARLGMF